jgi:hypothetical protein
LGDAGGPIDSRVGDLCNHVGFTDVAAPRGYWRLFEQKKSPDSRLREGRAERGGSRPGGSCPRGQAPRGQSSGQLSLRGSCPGGIVREQLSWGQLSGGIDLESFTCMIMAIWGATCRCFFAIIWGAICRHFVFHIKIKELIQEMRSRTELCAQRGVGHVEGNGPSEIQINMNKNQTHTLINNVVLHDARPEVTYHFNVSFLCFYMVYFKLIFSGIC